MAPMAIEIDSTPFHALKIKAQEIVSGQISSTSKKLIKEPMQLTGVLDKYESFDMTPALGREFPSANLSEWLAAPNADELVRELAVMGKHTICSLLMAQLT